MNPREVFLRLVHGVCDGPYEELSGLYAEQTHVTHPFHPLGPPPLRSRDELHEHFTSPPPDTRTLHRKPVEITVHETTDPEVIVAEFTYQGQVAETGEAFAVPCVFVMRIRDGLIVESRDYIDPIASARAWGQLDALLDALRPAPASTKLDLDRVDLEELAMALEDQSAYERRWLIDPRSGELTFWTEDGGIDGNNPVDLDELDPDLVLVEPLPSRVWFRDMADFAGLVSDERVAARLTRALDGKGAFRRFRNELHQRHPDLIGVWNAFRNVRAARHAVDWLLDNELIDEERATRFRTEHPDPDVP
ncbi:UPF0158 family protein [Paractinoplanes toevensis]|uniref:SnoaL-like domain-containing protein n=1 Tax=Paractinoplanes toevensis TaxID=571911 RepID=A0A919W9K1_9ACTN|nr:UPF0158 family protein [Actinoplanes toevensis]GIM96141.1 hypothetical protein Ato02nite_079340 [Actinoplanes toevensis]